MDLLLQDDPAQVAVPVEGQAEKQFQGEVIIPLAEDTALVVVPVPCTVLQAQPQAPTPRGTPILGRLNKHVQNSEDAWL